MVTSKPAASTKVMASRVRRATPPRERPAGVGRIKALGSLDRTSIRVLSPRIEPPEREEVGSTASTATLRPRAVRWFPKASMNVDFPTPGAPVIPRRIDGISGTGKVANSASAWAR